MKLHKNLIEAVTEALLLIFKEGRYADKVIEKLLVSNKRWGARDRAFIAESTYEMVRWWRLLWELYGKKPVLSRQELWNLFGTWWLSSGNELPPWEEFKTLNGRTIQSRYEKLKEIRKIRESIPDWLDKLGEEELGSVWGPELEALNEQAPVIIRANQLKTNRKVLAKLLAESGVEAVSLDDIPEGLLLKERQNVFRLPAFKEGLFEMQDASSQLVAPFLDVAPGMRVIDACAGAGGKTLHIAALMNNKGKVIAMDVEEWKLQQLKLRARRAGAAIIEPRLIDSNKVIKRLQNSADRVLLDVPCSGLGVLRRNPDAKWKLSPGFIEEVKGTQQNILTSYSSMVKPGGRLVYSTCSILPSENEKQVKLFLEKNKEFTLLDEKSISPAQTGFDGFYMACLLKK